MRCLAIAVISAGVSSPAVQAQQPSVVRLAKPDLEFAAEFSSVTGIHELSDGRIVVLDPKEKRIHLLDPHGGEPRLIGREGSGPGEFRRLFGLVPLSGDTTLVEDPDNNRFLILLAGRPVGTIPAIVIRPREGVTYGLSPRAADARGRLYMLLPLGLAPGERIPILRFDRASERFDTVGTVRNERFGVQRGRPVGVQRGQAGSQTIGVNAPTPFVVRDEWSVSPDGFIAIAHGDPYSVDWVGADGAMTKGAPITYTPVKVTDAEKAQWRAQQRESGGGTLTTTSGGRTMVQRIPVPEPASWPEVMPAFTGRAMVAAPDGSVWVMRAAPASAGVVTYDVINRRGNVSRRVEIPVAHKVVAFGAHRVYVVRQDEDGLLHLQRYAIHEFR
jgi:hypothetical protein